MEVLDTSIANVALQHIAGSLSASDDEATWVLTSYLVANAIVLPISGWLADVLGRKRFFMTASRCSRVASLLCGLAPSLTVLIVCRVAAGARRAAGSQPIAQSILADTFPPAKRGMAFARLRHRGGRRRRRSGRRSAAGSPTILAGAGCS